MAGLWCSAAEVCKVRETVHVSGMARTLAACRSAPPYRHESCEHTCYVRVVVVDSWQPFDLMVPRNVLALDDGPQRAVPGNEPTVQQLWLKACTTGYGTPYTVYEVFARSTSVARRKVTSRCACADRLQQLTVTSRDSIASSTYLLYRVPFDARTGSPFLPRLLTVRKGHNTTTLSLVTGSRHNWPRTVLRRAPTNQLPTKV
ncbi:hypothetical protein BDP55DRAFT_320393 [Colletotrichum godetiae]|uniref:Uncharacterized protein n=1 Tax=Colletotrichum godetiae TaxID=1209918 RepID=A0AAJ0AFZ3_9PEZI|nr:uncharacterized protein BDP55DRAFT_320393 [Colletotrichum godetiae]KAK1670981.1 hypothetical protein BDP55DRAFT_320393 [Colletotrichum godetiae]